MSDKKVKFLGIPVIVRNDSLEYSCKIGKINLLKIEHKIRKDNAPLSAKKIDKRKESDICIAVQLKGGIGDQLIGTNYVKALYDKISDGKTKIDVFCRPYINELFLQKQTFINDIFPEQDFNIQSGKYDVYLKLDRFPVVLRYDEKRITKNMVFLKYVRLLEAFRRAYPRFFNFGTSYDGVAAIYSIINKKKRIQQCDVDGFLKIAENFKFKIQCPQSSILKEYSLKKDKYITVHRGCDTNHYANSNKLWPLESYNQLTAMIKSHYPQYKIVQLGVNEKRCPTINNVDVNFVGKTILTDIPEILKNSVLHIDCEGGFVHIRHAVEGGVSIVLFGPTSKDFFGYSENINISSNVCPHWCEHLREKWDENCILTHGEPLCMKAIAAKKVFSSVSKILSEKGKK